MMEKTILVGFMAFLGPNGRNDNSALQQIGNVLICVIFLCKICAARPSKTEQYNTAQILSHVVLLVTYLSVAVLQSPSLGSQGITETHIVVAILVVQLTMAVYLIYVSTVKLFVFAREQKHQILLEMELEDSQKSKKLASAVEEIEKLEVSLSELSTEVATMTKSILHEFHSTDSSQLVILKAKAGENIAIPGQRLPPTLLIDGTLGVVDDHGTILHRISPGMQCATCSGDTCQALVQALEPVEYVSLNHDMEALFVTTSPQIPQRKSNVKLELRKNAPSLGDTVDASATATSLVEPTGMGIAGRLKGGGDRTVGGLKICSAPATLGKLVSERTKAIALLSRRSARALELHAESRSFGHQQDAALQRAFNIFDRDGDKKLDLVELLSVMNAMGESLDDEEAEILFAFADEDGNGQVSFEEFKLIWGTDIASYRATQVCWVGNIPDSVAGAEDAADQLREILSEFGRVLAVTLWPRNFAGSRTTWAKVEFKGVHAISLAITARNSNCVPAMDGFELSIMAWSSTLETTLLMEMDRLKDYDYGKCTLVATRIPAGLSSAELWRIFHVMGIECLGVSIYSSGSKRISPGMALTSGALTLPPLPPASQLPTYDAGSEYALVTMSSIEKVNEALGSEQLKTAAGSTFMLQRLSVYDSSSELAPFTEADLTHHRALTDTQVERIKFYRSRDRANLRGKVAFNAITSVDAVRAAQTFKRLLKTKGGKVPPAGPGFLRTMLGPFGGTAVAEEGSTRKRRVRRESV